MQTDIFGMMYQSYKFEKPIRLIELFGGYGSQHFSLKYLGLDVEHWKLCEWAVKSIQAYKDGHHYDDKTDYSKDMSKQEIIQFLYNKGISQNYNEPMTLSQIKRQKEHWLRNVYNNIKATKNMVNVQELKGKDLEIIDVDKYDYIMTYSFPCQDLSLAGLGKGMSRDGGTRSGMLWQVERVLDELVRDGLNLPHILLMENVPQVIGKENVGHFNEWQHKLESLGYKNYHKNLIATDFGIPQTRNRTFMVSILGDYSYYFPQPIKLESRLKDLLEKSVDEKYFLSSKQLEQISNWNSYQNPMDTIDKEQCPTLTTRSGAFAAGMVLTKDTENYIEWAEKGRLDSDCRAFKDHKVMGTLTTTPKNKVLENGDNLKTQLCDKLIEDNIVVENDVIKHSYTEQIMSGDKKCIEMNNLMPTLTTRPDYLGVTVKIGNYTPSKHNASNVVDSDYSAPTVMENHGTITATNSHDLRIRKLTPKECFRLMGVKDEDFERIAKNQSDASLYHLAGDSIVVDVLMAIFKQFIKEVN